MTTSKTKITFILLTLILVVVVGYRFGEYFINRNFVIVASAACDPDSGSCFFWDCTPEEADCDTSPYSKIEIAAHEAPACLLENSCEEFNCSAYGSCAVVSCSEDTRAYWEGCVTPSIFEETESIVEEILFEESDSAVEQDAADETSDTDTESDVFNEDAEGQQDAQI